MENGGQGNKRGGHSGGGKPKQRGKHFGPSGRQNHGRGNKRKDMGRQEYFRNLPDKRERNAEGNKRRKLEGGSHEASEPSGQFTKEEIEAEDRRPKRKVAVMIGYSGSGYKGMQIIPDQKTIEGDLFQAFIAAGAISKANAADPKKSSLVRCARTDKGVHAAGNVVSLKLIIEDEDVVQKINSHLPGQIRVWGIERTIGSFSCYQACDSRWYEYLIPTHCFLPPHPSSYLGKRVAELAQESGDMEGYQERQKDVQGWWAEAEQKYIKPVLDDIDQDLREKVEQAMYRTESAEVEVAEQVWDEKKPATNESATIFQDEAAGASGNVTADDNREFRIKLDAAIKRVKAAYIAAKESYRLSPERLSKVNDTLSKYRGTFNFHNYTVRKAPNDPSAKRHIKSFISTTSPSSKSETGTFEIGGTEWLSIKVHGQSFMMHQIRKMVGMAALVVRCGCPPERITETLDSDVIIAIPKAPGLGLLLERPVFDTYNSQRAAKFEREPITFDKYEKEMGEFKEREIYQRIYGEEDKDHVFHTFFSQIDNFKNPAFLYLSSKGFDAVPRGAREVTKKPVERGNRNIFRKRVEKGKHRSVSPSLQSGNVPESGEPAGEKEGRVRDDDQSGVREDAK
ncbi:pseudouridine synthase [Rhizodiscina lignyota]|uniref:tRNA pseudouridine synthase 1 n=1 Tax=Rhizodiscina lignyota TaxID=1504668 RepID=A0A9P4M1C5_9PEZI|nr:pseudouridine synthase [Rhizodiscina lignyota]